MSNLDEVVLGVSDFVALLNQTLEYAYPVMTIEGELANFRVSKNRWVYFDLVDEDSSVKFFGTVYQLPGPLENGMTVRIRGAPRLHPRFGFSVTIQAIQPVGEGTIRRASELLHAKLVAEGLFDETRKRMLPYPPERIGLITSSESAAYADFIKIMGARWAGVEIALIDTQVQGEAAPAQITQTITYFNEAPDPPEVLVIIRGGGSAEDLSVFNNEMVVRAVAGSRVPTLVAIGHEIDESLAELAADKRASTPSNAAELLVPDKKAALAQLQTHANQLTNCLKNLIKTHFSYLQGASLQMERSLGVVLGRSQTELNAKEELLELLNPATILRRGYAVVRNNHGKVVRSVKELKRGDYLTTKLSNGQFDSTVEKV